MKPLKNLIRGLVCESMVVEFRLPDHPVNELIIRMATCRDNGMLYYPYTLKDRASFGSNGWNILSFVLKAGPVELMTFQLGSTTHRHFPTLTLKINAELIYLMGADQLAWRVIAFIIKDTIPEWYRYACYRDFTLAINTPTPPDELLVWEKYHHAASQQKPAFWMENKTEQLRLESKVEIPDQMYALKWRFFHRKPIPVQSGVPELPDPYDRTKIYKRHEALLTMVRQREFCDLAMEIAESEQPDINFSQLVKERLSHHQRTKLTALLEPVQVKLWPQGIWERAWISTWRKWKCTACLII